MTNGMYKPESLIPIPSASNDPQNWHAPSFEDLWSLPIVGQSGPTVGDEIISALGPQGEIRHELEDLASEFPEVESRWSGDLRPRQAYREGFLQPLCANPHAGILSIIHWAPSYGLRSNDRDDVALSVGKGLHDQGDLGGMTTLARVKFIKELIGGSVGSDEEQLVVNIFETASPTQRPIIYEGVEGHEWSGNWIQGIWVSDDDIWNALNRQRLRTLKRLINEGWNP